jgi:hypothetical protein
MKAIVSLSENISTKLDPKGQLTHSSGSGKILVKNVSEQTTLWAISLNGTHGPDVSDFKEQSVPHIQPTKVFEDTYTIEHESKLLLSERIDTHYISQTGDDLDNKRNTLIKGQNQKILFEIQLENRYSFPLQDIIVTKNFDECVNDVDAIPPHPGSFERPSSAVWRIEHLGAGDIATIYLVVELVPENSERVKTGNIEVSATGPGLFSTLVPNVDAECDNVDLSVEVNETPTPGMWNITVAYTNASEFSTLLENVKVSHENENFIDSMVGEVVKPNPDVAGWTKENTIHSADYPQIDKDFKYQVEHEIQSHMSLTIVKESDLLDVIEIASEKRFEPESVNTYTRTPMKFIVEVSNKGTADIGRIEFEETIPPFILVKSVSAQGKENLPVTPIIDGQEGLDEVIPENIKDPRTLRVVVKTLDFTQNSVVTLSVECIAEKPKPNLDYHSQSIVQAFASVPTQPFTINSLMFEKVPELMVSYKKRSFKFSANYKAISESEYEITIPVTNNGEVPLENVFVTQSIVGGKYNSHTPLTIRAEEKADKIEFHLKAIPVGDTIPIVVVVETQGPLRQQQPSLRVAD